jgi:alginate O-acetyltransferase complex protein AlgI
MDKFCYIEKILHTTKKEGFEMLFSSIPFLFWFLPFVLIFYFIVPRSLKNTVLLLSSLFFYGWGEPRYVFWMVFAILMGYVFGLLIQRFRGNNKISKLLLVLSVSSSLAILGYFKYGDFFIENFNAMTGLSVPLLQVTLPIGISFYTFQILSYTVDVYRGDVVAQKNLVDLAAYVALFPQLIAGPIVRYSNVADQLKVRSHSFEKIAFGMRRFIIGLSKKIMIANQLGELCSLFRESGDKSVLFFWLYALAYALHIYFDFSGYSDMAIGLGKIFGFTFPENFNYPFISKSITEFWQRWHMSLGSWFRDYVYIPLGGNRVGVLRHLFNIFVVWMLTGFWHGAAWNFIVWGLFFALLLIIEKLWLLKDLKKKHIVNHVYVIFLTIISFVIFDATTMGQAFSYLKAMFGIGGYPLISEEFLYYFRSYGILFLIAMIGATSLPKKIWVRASTTTIGGNIVIFAEPMAVCVMLVVCTAYLVDGSFNPFLYFRF